VSGVLGVELLARGREEVPLSGPVGSLHEAELLVPAEAVAGLFTKTFLERVAAAYRRFLGRIWLGLLQVRSEPGYESILLLLPRPALLRFRAPIYSEGPEWAEVRWDIDRGLLVAREGRGQGYLEIRLRRITPSGADAAKVRVLARMEVSGYYPALRGSGRFAVVGTWLYEQTQARIHRRVLRGFLRSLVALELLPKTGASAPAQSGGP
jgi:hypothetical protein